MAQDNTLTIILLAVGGYYVYNYLKGQTGAGGAAAGAGQICKFPDNTTITMPAGNACPYDAAHGGQSTPCYPSSFVGPLPPGGAYCGI